MQYGYSLLKSWILEWDVINIDKTSLEYRINWILKDSEKAKIMKDVINIWRIGEWVYYVWICSYYSKILANIHARIHLFVCLKIVHYLDWVNLFLI